MRSRPTSAIPPRTTSRRCSIARTLAQGIGTRMRFSAGTVDQVPKQVAAGYMFGTAVTVPVPDIDRTDYMMILGANPYASNGSLCTAPDFPGRLEALRARGGKVVVVDPRRTKTAEEADEWVAIVPGTDAHFLMAIVHTLFDEGLADAGDHIRPWVNGWAEIEALAAGFAPERVGGHVRRRRNDDPPARPRAGRCSDRGGVRTHRHLHAGLRHARLVAGRRRERGDRQSRSSRAARCSACPPPAARRLAARPAREGLSHGARPHTGARPRRGAGGVPGRRARRGDRDRGARSGSGARHRGGQPGAFDAQQRAARRRPRAARVHGEHRHLSQRDDPSRGRDPPAELEPLPLALRPAAPPVRRA